MAGLTPPPHDWVGNDGKPIYFDSIDNSAYILGKAQYSARSSWIYLTAIAIPSRVFAPPIGQRSIHP